jgi:anti-sigma factor RsiW
MKHDLDVDLLRLLNGELPAAREQQLRRRMASEPELAAAFRRLERAWEGLELPPPTPVPLGFAGRVMAQVRERHAAAGAPAAAAGSLSWAAAPRWVRATAAVALLAGVLLGAGLGTRGVSEERRSSGGVPALTESYWAMVETAGDSAGPTSPTPPLPSSPRGEAHR